MIGSTTTKIIGAAGLGWFAMCGGLVAQTPTQPLARLRGAIADVAGDALTIKSRDGSMVSLHLKPNVRVGLVTRASLDDIKPGDFVGATTIAAKNGQSIALEIHIFPPAARGTGEGSRPWDLAPQSTMTNGAVSGSVQSSDGRTLTLSYKGGDKTFLVTPRTQIVFTGPGALSDVKAGVGVFVQPSARNADGSYDVDRITVGKDGVDPPQ